MPYNQDRNLQSVKTKVNQELTKRQKINAKTADSVHTVVTRQLMETRRIIHILLIAVDFEIFLS